MPPQPLIFGRQVAGRVKLDAPVVGTLASLAQATADAPEAGGVLIGRWILDSSDVVVDAVTVPGPRDRRSRFRFFRDRDHHQRAIDNAWRESRGSAAWLGEWHTHPEPDPTPSVTDEAGWCARICKDKAIGNALFFVIVGTSEIAVWEWMRGRLRPRRLARTTQA